MKLQEIKNSKLITAAVLKSCGGFAVSNSSLNNILFLFHIEESLQSFIIGNSGCLKTVVLLEHGD